MKDIYFSDFSKLVLSSANFDELDLEIKLKCNFEFETKLDPSPWLSLQSSTAIHEIIYDSSGTFSHSLDDSPAVYKAMLTDYAYFKTAKKSLKAKLLRFFDYLMSQLFNIDEIKTAKKALVQKDPGVVIDDVVVEVEEDAKELSDGEGNTADNKDIFNAKKPSIAEIEPEILKAHNVTKDYLNNDFLGSFKTEESNTEKDVFCQLNGRVYVPGFEYIQYTKLLIFLKVFLI